MNGGTLMNVKRILSAALFMTFFSCAGAPVVVSAMQNRALNTSITMTAYMKYSHEKVMLWTLH